MKDSTFRNRTAKAIVDLLPRVIKPAFRKYGQIHGSILIDWAQIVGPEMATRTRPDKLYFPKGQRNKGTLHITAASGSALLLQYGAPQLIERINTYYGYQAIESLRIHQEPLARTPSPTTASTVQKKVLTIPPLEGLETITDETLRTSLASFHESFARRQ